MRLVIPYRLAREGIELRYAIRSIYKYFPILSGVLLVGDRPTWYRGDHIPLADLKGQKERSMQLKVLQCEDAIFLYSNDDYYALAPFGADLPDYYDTTCRDMAERHTIASYKEMYNNCPPDWHNLDVHTPMIMSRPQFIVTYQAMGDVQTPIKTTYGRGLGSERIADCKIRGAHDLAELDYNTRDRPFFSTHDSAIDNNLIAFLDNLYPDASPYETP